jgi:predicted DNA-binding protein (UPF0251 family)
MLIRPQELEYLLWHCDELQEAHKELKIQIENIKKVEGDDDIYGCMTNRNFDGMPGTRRIADKTARTALNLRGLASECRKAIQEIRNEINFIGMIIDRLEMAKRRLSLDEQEMIRLRYDRRLTFQEMAAVMKTGKGQIKQKHGQALERMVQACRIEQDDYKKVLQIMKG